MASSLIRRTSGTRGTALCPLIFKLNSKVIRLNLSPYSFCVNELETSYNKAACQVIPIRCLSISSSLKRQPSPATSDSSASHSPQATPAVTQQLPFDDTQDAHVVFRERYIPVSRQSIVRHLIEEKDFHTQEVKVLLPGFVRLLDTVLVNKYHGVLEELKTLFDPINPDKDTIKSREWTRKEKLDNEFWLLQKLEEVMAKSNFHELPKNKVEHFLKDHQAQERVQVSVDPSRYDVLRFWVLGHDIPDLKPSLKEKVSRILLSRTPTKSKEYFKRVVVALRLKKDSKLILKAFKEVPVQNLEMLLPDGTIRMRLIDKGLLTSTAGIACFGVLAKMVTVLASLQVDWTLVLTLATGMLGFRVWSTYRNRRNAYLIDVSRTLYFKNIANNRSLLTLLVERAEDESLKEAVLTYTFLLNSSSGKNDQGLFANTQTDGLTGKELESTVEKWLTSKIGVNIEFDSSEAVRLLQSLGLLTEKDERYHVVPLDVATKVLPQSSQSIISRRAEEADFADGSNQDEYLETDDGYKSEDVKIKRFGWF